jgi:hypothetical protein
LIEYDRLRKSVKLRKNKDLDTYDVYKLKQDEVHCDDNKLARVLDGPDELVVALEQALDELLLIQRALHIRKVDYQHKVYQVIIIKS